MDVRESLQTSGRVGPRRGFQAASALSPSAAGEPSANSSGFPAASGQAATAAFPQAPRPHTAARLAETLAAWFVRKINKSTYHSRVAARVLFFGGLISISFLNTLFLTAQTESNKQPAQIQDPWAKWGSGAFRKTKTTTQITGETSVFYSTETLIRVGEEKYTISADDKEKDSAPYPTTLPTLLPAKKVNQETVTIDGKTFQCDVWERKETSPGPFSRAIGKSQYEVDIKEWVFPEQDFPLKTTKDEFWKTDRQSVKKRSSELITEKLSESVEISGRKINCTKFVETILFFEKENSPPISVRGNVWASRAVPGEEVRALIKGEQFEQISELVEFGVIKEVSSDESNLDLLIAKADSYSHWRLDQKGENSSPLRIEFTFFRPKKENPIVGLITANQTSHGNFLYCVFDLRGKTYILAKRGPTIGEIDVLIPFERNKESLIVYGGEASLLGYPNFALSGTWEKADPPKGLKEIVK